MWLCIFSHSAIKLTRVELRAKRPPATIERGEWNTRLIAACDGEGAVRGAKKVIDGLDRLFKAKRVAPGVYQLPYETVYEAYHEIMLSAQNAPKPWEYYGFWTIIFALFVWQVVLKVFTVFLWAILMLFMGGGKAGNVLIITLLLRLADTTPRIQYLLKEVRKL